MRFDVAKKINAAVCVCIVAICLFIGGCKSADDTRIPAMPVYIDLSNEGIWATYGVNAFGGYNYFVLQSGSEILPHGFAYKQNSATGFGGVLLTRGQDPFTGETNVPLAYDLACPVECDRNIRVYMTGEPVQAVCPVCDSHYNVVTGAGAPTAGVALTGDRAYSLKRYYCRPTSFGGYVVSDMQ